MILPRVATVALALTMAHAALPAAAAEPAREVHGSADAFAANGIALAWAVLRGAGEADTVAVVRVAATPAEFPAMTATGSDPFSARTNALPVTKSAAGRFDVRVARAHFADFPRTDFRFYGTAATTPSGPPKLVVFYLGVPDTTPEFASEAALDAYLADRLARLGVPAAGKPP